MHLAEFRVFISTTHVEHHSLEEPAMKIKLEQTRPHGIVMEAPAPTIYAKQVSGQIINLNRTLSMSQRACGTPDSSSEDDRGTPREKRMYQGGRRQRQESHLLDATKRRLLV